jgi:hypothetical protein
MLAERLLDGEVEAMLRTVIETAKQGDMVALRLCLDRIVPPRCDRPVYFTASTKRTESRFLSAIRPTGRSGANFAAGSPDWILSLMMAVTRENSK